MENTTDWWVVLSININLVVEPVLYIMYTNNAAIAAVKRCTRVISAPLSASPVEEAVAAASALVPASVGVASALVEEAVSSGAAVLEVLEAVELEDEVDVEVEVRLPDTISWTHAAADSE